MKISTHDRINEAEAKEEEKFFEGFVEKRTNRGPDPEPVMDPDDRPLRHVKLVLLVRDSKTRKVRSLTITRFEDPGLTASNHTFSLNEDDLHSAGHVIEQAWFAVLQMMRDKGHIAQGDVVVPF